MKEQLKAVIEAAVAQGFVRVLDSKHGRTRHELRLGHKDSASRIMVITVEDLAATSGPLAASVEILTMLEKTAPIEEAPPIEEPPNAK